MRTSRAVVLARGLGTRMRADDGARLSEDQRRAADAGLKGMMPIRGRPFLDYVLSTLADAGLRDVALVVAPDHEVMRRHYEDLAPPSRVDLSFVVQPEPAGTADAVRAVETWTRTADFVTVNADNLYPSGVLRALAALPGPALPVFQRGNLVRTSNIPGERVQSFAIVETTRDGYLARIIEKPANDSAGSDPRALVSMNCWRFDSRIFAACRAVPRSIRGEFELPEAVGLALEQGVRFRALEASGPVLDLSRRADAEELARRLAGVVPHP